MSDYETDKQGRPVSHLVVYREGGRNTWPFRIGGRIFCTPDFKEPFCLSEDEARDLRDRLSILLVNDEQGQHFSPGVLSADGKSIVSPDSWLAPAKHAKPDAILPPDDSYVEPVMEQKPEPPRVNRKVLAGLCLGEDETAGLIAYLQDQGITVA